MFGVSLRLLLLVNAVQQQCQLSQFMFYNETILTVKAAFRLPKSRENKKKKEEIKKK